MSTTDPVHTVCAYFMSPGHTWFESDRVAHKIAHFYNKEDSFNQAMLMEHIKHVNTSQAYDGHLLESRKEGSKLIFGAVGHTMTYKYFLTVGDNGS